MNLRECEMLADLREWHYSVFLFKKSEQRPQVCAVVFVEISLERGERRIQNAPVIVLRQNVKIDRLEKRRVALHRAINDFLLPDFTLPDNLRVRHAVCRSEYFLRRQFEVLLDLQPLARVMNRVNSPG